MQYLVLNLWITLISHQYYEDKDFQTSKVSTNLLPYSIRISLCKPDLWPTTGCHTNTTDVSHWWIPIEKTHIRARFGFEPIRFWNSMIHLESAKSIGNTPALSIRQFSKSCSFFGSSLSSTTLSAYSKSDEFLSEQVSESLFSYESWGNWTS